LTALAAMVISRVFKLGQETARHASAVASTSLQEIQKNKKYVRKYVRSINYFVSKNITT